MDSKFFRSKIPQLFRRDLKIENFLLDEHNNIKIVGMSPFLTPNPPPFPSQSLLYICLALNVL